MDQNANALFKDKIVAGELIKTIFGTTPHKITKVNLILVVAAIYMLGVVFIYPVYTFLQFPITKIIFIISPIIFLIGFSLIMDLRVARKKWEYLSETYIKPDIINFDIIEFEKKLEANPELSVDIIKKLVDIEKLTNPFVIIKLNYIKTPSFNIIRNSESNINFETDYRFSESIKKDNNKVTSITKYNIFKKK